LGEARVRAFAQLRQKDSSLRSADGMDAIRGLVAGLEGTAPRGVEMAIDLADGVAVASAAWQRASGGFALVPPDASRGHAEDYLRMALGEVPDAAGIAAMDRYLVTVMDHGMNASTFTARVVASTGSDALSAVVAGIGALKGPLHGGAPGPVLDMLDAVGEPEHARAWVERELAEGRRIMGMGHRIYRVRDPRAAVLEKGIELLEQSGVARGRLALARAVESPTESVLAARHPERPLKCNVEFFPARETSNFFPERETSKFYTAVLLDAVGLDRRAFSPTFAVGRVVGWCAHIEEQRRIGRLVRPASNYVGRMQSSRGCQKFFSSRRNLVRIPP